LPGARSLVEIFVTINTVPFPAVPRPEGAFSTTGEALLASVRFELDNNIAALPDIDPLLL
jgi:hypothetical protein